MLKDSKSTARCVLNSPVVFQKFCNEDAVAWAKNRLNIPGASGRPDQSCPGKAASYSHTSRLQHRHSPGCCLPCSHILIDRPFLQGHSAKAGLKTEVSEKVLTDFSGSTPGLSSPMRVNWQYSSLSPSHPQVLWPSANLNNSRLQESSFTEAYHFLKFSLLKGRSSWRQSPRAHEECIESKSLPCITWTSAFASGLSLPIGTGYFAVFVQIANFTKKIAGS